MSEDKAISGPLWSTLVGALVAAIMVVAAFFVFVQSGEAASHAADEQPSSASASPKITDGKAVTNGKYPFMSFLTLTFADGPDSNNKPEIFYCGGSLIDADSVLTAAHCVLGETRLLKAKVEVGRTVLSSNQGQVRSVKRAFIHPDYKFPNYDAAVLDWSRPVSGIAPIKLASSKQNYLEKPGRKATVAGWGSTTARPACLPTFVSPVFPNRMRQAQVPIVSDARADQLYQDLSARSICRFRDFRFPYTPSPMVAAGGTGKDACQGDSGGPLFVARAPGGNGGNDGKNGDGDNGASSPNYTQIGITSFGPGCGTERFPAVYTEVNNPSIRSFIKSAASK
jgi:secreted trypsin-like serine protease